MAFLASLLFALAAARPLTPIPSEATSLRGHLLPNEFDNHRQYPNLRGGAVIAVGTFRAFNLAAAVRAHYLVAFDAAESVRRYDDDIAAAVLAYDRADFVAFMLGAARPLGTREEALGWIRARKLKQLAYHPMNFRVGLFERYLALKPQVSEHDARVDYLETFLEYFVTPERFAATFFGSDESYRHVRDLIRAGRYHAVTGRLEGPTAFAEVALALAGVGAQVSVLDVSNALDFVGTRDGVGKFVANVRRLRFAPGGLVLYTHHNGQWSPFPEFDYLRARPEPFLRSLTLATCVHTARFKDALKDACFESHRLCADAL